MFKLLTTLTKVHKYVAIAAAVLSAIVTTLQSLVTEPETQYAV